MSSSPNKTLADQIVEAYNTGKEAVITYNGTDYTVDAAGLAALVVAVLGNSENIIGNAISGNTIFGSEVDGDALSITGTVVFSGLPTADPAVAGELWSNAGVVTVSAG